MYRSPLATRAFLTLLLVATAVSASAQEGIYVQGSAFADIREYGSSSGGILDIDEFSRDGTGFGGSIRVGTWLHRRWPVEAGLDLTNRTTAEYRNPFILAIFPPTLAPRDLKATTSFASVTTMLGFHQGIDDGIRLGYRAGFSFLRATHRTEFPDFTIASPTSGLLGGIYSVLLPQFPIRFADSTDSDTNLTLTENIGALALGFEAAIEIGDTLAVVPELRAFAFSTSGRGVFLIRPGAGVRWNF